MEIEKDTKIEIKATTLATGHVRYVAVILDKVDKAMV
jgi:hypothetical protein